MGAAFAAGRCHVISCSSGSGWLKHAAKLQNRSPITVFTFDRLIQSAGPIAGTTNPELYKNWCDQFAPGLRKFSGLDHANYISEFERTWERLLAWTGPVSFWFSRKNIREASFYLGFLESYPRPDSIELIDVSSLGGPSQTITGTGECSEGLLETAWINRFRLSPEDIKLELRRFPDHYKPESGLRVFEEGQMISAPIEYHDGAILDQLDRDWLPLNDVMGHLFAIDQCRDTRQLEHFYLLWRVKMLDESGQLECIGNFEEGDLRGSAIRKV